MVYKSGKDLMDHIDHASFYIGRLSLRETERLFQFHKIISWRFRTEYSLCSYFLIVIINFIPYFLLPSVLRNEDQQVCTENSSMSLYDSFFTDGVSKPQNPVIEL